MRAVPDGERPDPSRFLREHFGRRIDVGQGEHVVIDTPGVEVAATLGSCVAILLHDPAGAQGGMNHIHVCVDPGPLGGAAVVTEIETLVNALMRRGARRSDLVARIAGGAHLLGRGRNVGARIAGVCLDYLTAEGIVLAQRELGGTRARRVLYQPTTGVMALTYPGIADLRTACMTRPKKGNDAELF